MRTAVSKVYAGKDNVLGESGGILCIASVLMLTLSSALHIAGRHTKYKYQGQGRVPR